MQLLQVAIIAKEQKNAADLMLQAAMSEINL
jgi:hypothetical protein